LKLEHGGELTVSVIKHGPDGCFLTAIEQTPHLCAHLILTSVEAIVLRDYLNEVEEYWQAKGADRDG
jgi:hypothetical protein